MTPLGGAVGDFHTGHEIAVRNPLYLVTTVKCSGTTQIIARKISGNQRRISVICVP